jgi:hypothetical protein
MMQSSRGEKARASVGMPGQKRHAAERQGVCAKIMLKQKHERGDDWKEALAARLRRIPADQVDRGLAQPVERVARVSGPRPNGQRVHDRGCH